MCGVQLLLYRRGWASECSAGVELLLFLLLCCECRSSPRVERSLRSSAERARHWRTEFQSTPPPPGTPAPPFQGEGVGVQQTPSGGLHYILFTHGVDKRRIMIEEKENWIVAVQALKIQNKNILFIVNTSGNTYITLNFVLTFLYILWFVYAILWLICSSFGMAKRGFNNNVLEWNIIYYSL